MNSVKCAPNASSDFSWKWELKDLEHMQSHDHTVFSCFSCGGGSSMGYKRAGYEVIGNCEIDEKTNQQYRANLKPKFSYCCDIRDFLDIGLPKALYNLDILDGSPPCTTFSMAGDREKTWTKEKRFAEGQKTQRLDDLSFEFIKVVKELQPKIVVMENVKGIILGNAKGYCNEILKAMNDANYHTQMFLLNSATMGVPQQRERVFFVSRRKDLKYKKLVLHFDQTPILFGAVREPHGESFAKKDGKYEKLLKHRIPTDRVVSDINMRLYGTYSGFTNRICCDDEVFSTVTSGGNFFRMCDGKKVSRNDFINLSTFPQDYQFTKSVQFTVGMSVPPMMMEQIAKQIYLQWLK